MAQEIEKKYLIREYGVEYTTPALMQLCGSVSALKNAVINNGKSIRQGYLPPNVGLELSNRLNMSLDFNPSEARLREKDGVFSFTLKGSGALTRNELDVKIKQALFDEYWPKTRGQRVEKIRLNKPFGRYIAEIDAYTDRDLIVAEVEVPSIQDAEKLSPLGKDVTDDNRYKNKNLAR